MRGAGDKTDVGPHLQMLRHRRNQPPGYTASALKEIQAKADELVGLLRRHWMPYQASGWLTVKVCVCVCTCMYVCVYVCTCMHVCTCVCARRIPATHAPLPPCMHTLMTRKRRAGACDVRSLHGRGGEPGGGPLVEHKLRRERTHQRLQDHIQGGQQAGGHPAAAAGGQLRAAASHARDGNWPGRGAESCACRTCV